MNWYWLAAIAALGGMTTALQAHFMGLLDQRVGTLENVFITYVGGGILIGLVMLIVGRGNFGAAGTVPWYAYMSGALGILIVGTLGFSAPRLGLVTAFTIFVAAQCAMGALMDHFGWLGASVRPFNASRLAGLVIVLIGIWLIIRE